MLKSLATGIFFVVLASPAFAQYKIVEIYNGTSLESCEGAGTTEAELTPVLLEKTGSNWYGEARSNVEFAGLRYEKIVRVYARERPNSRPSVTVNVDLHHGGEVVSQFSGHKWDQVLRDRQYYSPVAGVTYSRSFFYPDFCEGKKLGAAVYMAPYSS